MKTRIVVSALIRKGDSYLFGRKKPGVGPYPNSWVTIGGGVEIGKETLEEALRREIKEEIGVVTGPMKRVSFDEDDEPDKNGEMTHYIFLTFETEYLSGELHPGDDIVEVKWFPKSELSGTNLSRPSQKLFRELKLL